MACASNGVGCVVGEAGAGAVVGGAAVVADERPDVGSNRAAAASTGDSFVNFWCSRRVSAGTDTPATVSAILRW